jgi:nudix-type nucleoside diphosphatase (YffH/AdpP family)
MSERIKIVESVELAREWGRFTNYTIDYRRKDGQVQRFKREVYDHGSAAAILLFDPARETVLLVRQFRFPVLLNGDAADLLEACAGMLDGDLPEACAIREAIEETGHAPEQVRHVCDVYASPGAMTEKISLFVGHYSAGTRQHGGGGLIEEGEEIEVVELPLSDAMAMIGSGQIMDAKTVILLQYLAAIRLAGRTDQ